VSSCVEPKKQKRLIHFMCYVFENDKEAAWNILNQYSCCLQVDILDEKFKIANLDLVLEWDILLHSPLMLNPADSHMHTLMQKCPQPRLACHRHTGKHGAVLRRRQKHMRAVVLSHAHTAVGAANCRA